MRVTVLSVLDLAIRMSTTYHKIIGARPTGSGTARLESGTSLLGSRSTISMTSHADSFA